MFQENSIATCILSRVKQITSPGWMHETSARTWCTGKTQRDRVEREVGGWIRMGNTCKSMADSFQCMTKPTTKQTNKQTKKLRGFRAGRRQRIQGVDSTSVTYQLCTHKPLNPSQLQITLKITIAILLFLLKVLVTQSYLTLCHPMDCSPSGSYVHGILQATILEWVAISFSRGSSQARDRTLLSHNAGRLLLFLLGCHKIRLDMKVKSKVIRYKSV